MDADVGVCASQSERERLLREGGTRRRQLSVPSVVVPPVVFLKLFFPSIRRLLFSSARPSVSVLYVNIIAIPVSG